MKDDWLDVRIVAAEALSYLGETELAIKTLTPIIKSDEEFLSLAALNALDFMQQAGHISLQRIRKLIEGVSFKTTPERMARYFRDGA